MFPTPVSRFSICALVVAGAILAHPNDAKADPVVVGHNVVYFDESGKPYSLDGQHKEKGKDGKWHLIPQISIDFKIVNGVPTATAKTSTHNVTPGSILLKDPGTTSTDSDLIVFGPIPKPGEKQKQTMQFCSDDSKETPPDPKADVWADVGVSKCKSQDPVKPFTEKDLSDFTVILHYKEGDDFDVTAQLDLKGKFGYIYEAGFGMPGADTASGEDPILYVFVSDSCREGTGKSPTSSCAPTVPEPPSLLLLGSSLFVLACLPIVMRFRWLIL